jgi:hypothetical protein
MKVGRVGQRRFFGGARAFHSSDPFLKDDRDDSEAVSHVVTPTSAVRPLKKWLRSASMSWSDRGGTWPTGGQGQPVPVYRRRAAGNRGRSIQS